MSGKCPLCKREDCRAGNPYTASDREKLDCAEAQLRLLRRENEQMQIRLAELE